MADSSTTSRRTSPTLQLLQRPDFAGSFARFWTSSYAPDYFGLLVLLVFYILMLLWVEPFHRMFTLDNHNIQFPHAAVERVPPDLLIIYAAVVPLFTLTLWAVAFRPRIHKAHVTFLGLMTSIFITIIVTDIIKNAVGRPRPDLLARCKPAVGTPEHVLVTIDVCTETDHHILHDGWRSFPSGHSSFSFSGLGYLSLVIAGQLHVLHPASSLPPVILACIPLLGALLIAISRCEDYRHDVYDVTVGSIIGFTIAYLTYRRYYPSLRSRKSETPFPSKAELLVKAGVVRPRDEEEAVGGFAPHRSFWERSADWGFGLGNGEVGKATAQAAADWEESDDVAEERAFLSPDVGRNR